MGFPCWFNIVVQMSNIRHNDFWVLLRKNFSDGSQISLTVFLDKLKNIYQLTTAGPLVRLWFTQTSSLYQSEST